MPFVISDVKTESGFFAFCEKCNASREFCISKADTSLVFKFIKYRRNFAAICMVCNSVYNVSEEDGRNLLKGKGTLVLGNIKNKR